MIRSRILSLLLSVAASLLLASLFLWATGYSPFSVFRIIATNSWGSQSGLMLVSTKTALLILSGLAVVVPYRAGLFNIGGEGQILWGGVMAAYVGTLPLSALGPFHLLLCLLVGILCGALWAWIAAFLKNLRNIHEVISTIMLNFIAFQFVNELTFGVLNGGEGVSRTGFVRESAYMPVLMQRGAADTSWAIVLSGVFAVLLSVLLYRTWFGFSLRAVGANPTASAYAGIPVGRIRAWSMLIGGGCAGLAGAVQVTGVDRTFYARFGGGYGFDGIAVAFLALNEPWAAIPAALAVASLRAADRTLQLDLSLPKEMVLMLEGILILCIAVFTRKKDKSK